jgi:flagellar basal body-associated protein FliL
MNKKKNQQILLSCLIVLLSAVYVAQVIELGKINFLLGRQEKEAASLKEERNSLKLAVSRGENLNNLENKIAEQGYSKMGKVDFLVISASSVAIKD